jgi:hypothetical protein
MKVVKNVTEAPVPVVPPPVVTYDLIGLTAEEADMLKHSLECFPVSEQINCDYTSGGTAKLNRFKIFRAQLLTAIRNQQYGA